MATMLAATNSLSTLELAPRDLSAVVQAYQICIESRRMAHHLVGRPREHEKAPEPEESQEPAPR